jgi:hypothetical protein
MKIDKDPEESRTGSLGTVCCICADVDESLGSSLKPTRISDQAITTREDNIVESSSTKRVCYVNDLSRSLSKEMRKKK